MSYKKEIVTAVGTLAIAVGIGFIMQRTDGAQTHYGQASVVPVAAAATTSEAPSLTGDVLDVQSIELTSASETTPIPTPTPDTAINRVSASASDVIAPPAADRAPLLDSCEITASAQAVSGAMVRLSLQADCAPNERVTVHHNGMMFTQATDEAGGMTTIVPALAQEAVFILAFAGGDGAVAQVNVPDITQYERVAIQWRGNTGFQLHAREFGANYGDAGHVWADSDTDMEGLKAGTTGMLVRLGSETVADPLLAEVYTFGAAMANRAGSIDMSVEAEVTAANCAQEIEAQSLEMGPGGAITTHDLTLSVPACDAIGDFLVLNNLIPDMKVAAN